MCRYYQEYNRCKFGSYCAYSHTVKPTSEDKLTAEVDTLKIEVKSLRNKVTELIEIIHELNEVKVKSSTPKETQERHTNTEEKIELHCEKCQFVTKSILMYSEIREHMREKHRIFKCDTCDFTSSSEVGLKVHITKVHARLYPIETKQQKPDIPVEKSKHTHHWNDEPTSAKCNMECKL